MLSHCHGLASKQFLARGGGGVNDDRGTPITVPELSLSANPGATRPGETFQPNSFTGTAEVTVPLYASPARGAEPNLALRYTSGGANGVFGLGFRLSVPSVSRRTDLGIPRYAGHDTFVLADGGFLVPRYERTGGTWRPVEREEELDGRPCRAVAYRRGVESAFDVIELWTHLTEPVSSFWRMVGSVESSSRRST